MLVPRRGSSDHHRSQAVCTAVADGTAPQHQHHHQHQHLHLHHHQQQRRTSNMEIIAEERNV
ncbi:hypothetical protein KR215_006035 [Drosophila sulfurigaster]|nr:hypothetical protein KR215_006035 [Drosophila sulfurigaster]